MSSFSPNPQNPYVPTPTRTRVKWENISIILVGVAMAAAAVVYIMSGETTKPSGKPPVTAAPATLDAAAPPVAPEDDLTLDDALGLVEEARSLMLEARWDDAADRLASIPDQFRVETDADTVATDLAATKVRWETLTAKLATQVEQEEWVGASATLRSLTAMARLDNELTATKALVDEQLAPAPKLPAKAAAAIPAVTGGGATATTAKPATRPAAAKPTASRPATAKPTAARPAGATAPTVTGGGASSNGSVTNTAAAVATAGIDSNLIDQQLLDEINLALEDAMAGGA